METFAALAEPHRRLILDQLRRANCTVGMLVDTLGISQPAVSKHLRVLREANLVTVLPEGQRRWYALNPQALADLDSWLEPYRQLWADRLDDLDRYLDETNKTEKDA